MIDARPGLCVIEVTGGDALFADEAGGHRWQRIPPTEKRGRVQTSTVTVAVLPTPAEQDLVLAPGDLHWETVRGTGAGGQHRNVTESAVRVRHRPTGIEAYCQSERSQHRNKASALSVLRARVWDAQQAAQGASRAADRRQQIGSGMRGDKRRTIRVRDGQVVDHVTGQHWRWAEYERGNW